MNALPSDDPLDASRPLDGDPSDAGRSWPGRHGLPTTDLPRGTLPKRGLVGELRGVHELPRLLLRAPSLARMPRGDGAPVLDLPGWQTSERSMAPLRRFLRRLGHDARPWGLGRNRGLVDSYADGLDRTITQTVDRTGRQVALVGWSLGGVIAREAARRRPDEVSQVITFGSPIVDVGVHTAFAPDWSEDRRRTHVAAIATREAADPLRVPVTSIYTRRDAVVPWRASLDHHSADVRHIEVGSTHLSMGIDPDVWEIVARLLAAA